MNLSEERLRCIEADMLKPGHMPCESCRDIVRELIAAVREGRSTMSSTTVSEKCERPPTGWACTRPRGHEGPCAAVPRDVVLGSALVSEPSAGPRDRFNALAEKLVTGIVTYEAVRQALKAVYYEGRREGESDAKAAWGEAVEEEDESRAFRVADILFGDDEISGNRSVVEERLAAEFAELRAVARHERGVRSSMPNAAFYEALEKQRSIVDEVRNHRETLTCPTADTRLADAVQFLLAIAHQPGDK